MVSVKPSSGLRFIIFCHFLTTPGILCSLQPTVDLFFLCSQGFQWLTCVNLMDQNGAKKVSRLKCLTFATSESKGLFGPTTYLELMCSTNYSCNTIISVLAIKLVDILLKHSLGLDSMHFATHSQSCMILWWLSCYFYKLIINAVFCLVGLNHISVWIVQFQPSAVHGENISIHKSWQRHGIKTRVWCWGRFGFSVLVG